MSYLGEKLKPFQAIKLKRLARIRKTPAEWTGLTEGGVRLYIVANSKNLRIGSGDTLNAALRAVVDDEAVTVPHHSVTADVGTDEMLRVTGLSVSEDNYSEVWSATDTDRPRD